MAMNKDIENAKTGEMQAALREKINQAYDTNQELLANDYYTGYEVVTLDFIPEDTSYQGFYNEIKKLDTYKNAKLV